MPADTERKNAMAVYKLQKAAIRKSNAAEKTLKQMPNAAEKTLKQMPESITAHDRDLDPRVIQQEHTRSVRNLEWREFGWQTQEANRVFDIVASLNPGGDNKEIEYYELNQVVQDGLEMFDSVNQDGNDVITSEEWLDYLYHVSSNPNPNPNPNWRNGSIISIMSHGRRISGTRGKEING